MVIDGHVDSAQRGLGAFFSLKKMHSGDEVTLTLTDGSRAAYQVYARQVYAKDKPLSPDLFARTGPRRLVLITCGGAFDSATHHYRDNVVVLAAP
ncbi:MAG TPA: class F sortase, partial [Frankiaceae bacterium]|nr:class F sortase [Frankiaceae bacterium]